MRITTAWVVRRSRATAHAPRRSSANSRRVSFDGPNWRRKRAARKGEYSPAPHPLTVLSMFVAFDDVCKTYDGRINVVDHLDLGIAEGEFLSLLGPSGSGKTTTLLMLAGFERPTAGHIRLRGQPIDDLPPYRRNFG